ncbi:MAG: ABC transporter permease [bacterium]
MNTRILIRNSLRNLSHHKVRSFLTILGIIVGIASVIATLAIGYGTEQKLRQKIMSMGCNYIELWAGNSFAEGASAVTKRTNSSRLSLDDVKLFKTLFPAIKHITPFFHSRTNTEFQTNSIKGQVKAGNQNFFSVIGRSIKHGHFFNYYQVQKGARVVVLGHKAAKELFRSLDPIGQIVMIKKIPFTVIGIAKKIENFFGIHDPNLEIFVPFTTFNRYISPDASKFVHGIIISSYSTESMPQVVKQIRKNLRMRHNLKLREPDDFTIIDQESMLKAAKDSSSVFNLFLFIVASISLIVGGIGVMNIMLVSVSERSQEIGIRMALGACERLILRQFLIESVTLCFVGGIIGIILGIIAPLLANYFAGFPVVINIQTIFAAFVTIFLVGLSFGFYPAYKASRLNPVEAINSH